MLKKHLPILTILLILLASFAFGQGAMADCNCYCKDGSIHPAADRTDCADNVCDGNRQGMDTSPGKGCQPITPSGTTKGGSGSPIKISNPLDPQGGPITPETLYARIIAALLAFVGIASLVAFVYAGFVFLISAGNPERVKKAKDTMLYAVIGIFVAMASYAILSFIFTTLEGATGN